jgi:hypothetical protein
MEYTVPSSSALNRASASGQPFSLSLRHHAT